MQPKYAEIIIVAVIYRSEMCWYVSDKDFWFLDLEKYEQAFIRAGFQVPEDNSYRFGIPVVKQDMVAIFLENMEQYKVDVLNLSKMLVDGISIASSWEDVVDFFPVLMVNFDQRRLQSLFPEMIKFEDYLPDGWDGQYYDFYPEIPQEQRYWLIDGVDCFAKFSQL